MASFTLPDNLSIKGKEVSAIDMQFEKIPKTFNKEGIVMNQGSKFVAQIPNSNHFISYDGHGRSEFISELKAQELIDQGYEKLPDNWWEKANLL